MEKLRMGIIGTGMAFEKLHYPQYQKLQDKYQIVAICDQDQQHLDKWQNTLGLRKQDTYNDFREIMRRVDIDAFDILVPIELNFEVTEAVARAGKPIICEKPLAPTMEQAEAAKELAAKYKIPIMIAENFRYNEEINIIRDMLRTEKVGRTLYFLWNRVVNFPQDMLGNKFPATEWRQYPEFPGGAILDTGVHDIAALRHIFGAVDRVQSFGRRQREDFSPYSVLTTNVVCKSGVIGNYTFFNTGMEMQRPLIGLRIFCSGGEIFLEERDCGTINVAYNDGHSERISYQPQQGYYNELVNFYQAAINNEPISVPPELEFGDARMLFAMLESVREDQMVPVDRSEDYVPAYDGERRRGEEYIHH